MNTQILRIQSTDVILTDYEPGKGKIIISDDNYGYNFSYYWGAMGSGDLRAFLCDISPSYFTGKLGTTESGGIDIKATMANVRRWWKEDSGIAYYQNMDEQKQLRIELNMIQNLCYDEQDFVSRMSRIDEAFYFRPAMFKSDFQEAIEALSCEPWHHIEKKEHKQNLWLNKFFTLLKKEIAS